MSRRVILDIDTGTDDAQAIFLALKSPELKVEALTTVFGNSTIDRTTRNTCKILELVRESESRNVEDIHVAEGMHKSLLRLYLSPEERVKKSGQKPFHGFDGLGGLIDSGYLTSPKIKPVKQHAVNLIIDKIMENPGEITLIPVGPLTNIAMAILKEPKVAKNVKEIILMGGAFETTPYGHGNVTPVAEANIWNDPEAAKIVYECGARVTAVGLDVTTHPSARITEEHLKQLRPEDPIEDLVIKMNEFRIQAAYRRKYKVIGSNVHDALAVAVAIDPSLVQTQPHHVQVVTLVPDNDPTRGQTIADRRGESLIEPNIYVCTNVDGERWINFFLGRMKR